MVMLMFMLKHSWKKQICQQLRKAVEEGGQGSGNFKSGAQRYNVTKYFQDIMLKERFQVFIRP